MHLVKDILMLTTDIYTDFFTQCVEFFCDLTGCFLTCTGICDHHHVEVAIQDSLCDIKDIHLIICQISTNFCNDSYSIFSYYCDNCFFIFLLLYTSTTSDAVSL